MSEVVPAHHLDFALEKTLAHFTDRNRAALDLAYAQQIYRQTVVGNTPPAFLLN